MNIFLNIIFCLLLSYYTYASEEINIIYASTMPDITTQEDGTYSQLATLLKKERLNNPNTIFLFGGNSLATSGLSSLDKGIHIVEILNTLEPDVMAIDKKDFGFFENELSLRSFESYFPFVASNILEKKTNKYFEGFNSNVLLNIKKDLSVGVISVLQKDVVYEYALDNTLVQDIKTSIKNQSKELRKNGADIIILLSSDVLLDIQDLFTNNIIDFSLTKETFNKISKKQLKNLNDKNIIIKKMDNILKLNIKTKNNKLSSYKKEFISLNTLEKEPIVQKQIDDYTKNFKLLLKEPITIIKSKMDTRKKNLRTKENAFANLCADAIKQYTNAQISLINSGTIRGNKLYEDNHKLTKLDIIKELPYRNEVVLLKVQGRKIIKAIENGLSLIKQYKGRFLQVSGLRIEYNIHKTAGQRVIKVLFNNKEIQLDKYYTLATTNYIYSGGDEFNMFKNEKKLKSKLFSNDRLLSEIVTEYIKKNPNIDLIIDGRLIQKNEN